MSGKQDGAYSRKVTAFTSRAGGQIASGQTEVSVFIIREYAACALMALMLAALLLVACGMGYLLKVTGIMFLRTLQSVAHRKVSLKRVATRLSSRNVICAGAEPSVIAGSPL